MDTPEEALKMETVAGFKKRFKAFDFISDEDIQMALDDTALLMGYKTPERWVGFFKVAHACYTAHWLVVSEIANSGDASVLSPISTQKVDDTLLNFAIADVRPSLEDLYSTSYGKRYLHYRKIAFSGIIGV